MVAAHNNTLEGVGILLSGLFVATSKGLDANLLAKLCVLIYLCRLIFIFACEPSFLPLRVAAVAWTITLPLIAARQLLQTTPTSTCCAQPCGSRTLWLQLS
jgi:hypothetical protein